MLTFAPNYGLGHVGWKVQHAEDLDLYQARLEAAGVVVKRLAAGEWGPGHGEALRFETPTGHQMELVHGMQQIGNLLPLTNPPPRPLNMVGIAPPRIDHVFLTCRGRQRGDRTSSPTSSTSTSPSRSSATTASRSRRGWRSRTPATTSRS